MTQRTRIVIGVAVGLIAILTGLVLLELFGTILLAITVAYVLTPVQGWFLTRGWRRRSAAIATTVIALVSALVVVTPLALVAYRYRGEVAAVVSQLPEAITIEALGFTGTLEMATVIDTLVSYVPTILLQSAVALSAFSIKFALFAMVVFGLLVGHERARAAILAPIPPTYLDFVGAMEERARETLVAILVLQVGTAVGTFVLAVPTFWLLGYDYVVVLSAIAGALQFLPIIGPIVLLLALGAVHVMAGEVIAAALVVGVGGLVIGWLPDLLVRPKLVQYTTGMSGSLYFVGFIGGITSLGMIGILAGPLFVALLVEGIDQLAAQMDHTDRTPSTETVGDGQGPTADPGATGGQKTRGQGEPAGQ